MAYRSTSLPLNLTLNSFGPLLRQQLCIPHRFWSTFVFPLHRPLCCIEPIPPLPQSGARGPVMKHHSVGQVSLHSSHRMAASLVVSSTSAASSNPLSAAGPPSTFLPGRDSRALPGLPGHAREGSAAHASSQRKDSAQQNLALERSGGPSGHPGGKLPAQEGSTAFDISPDAPSDSSSSTRVTRAGAAASLALGEAAVMSAWGVLGPGGGAGCRLATTPRASGTVLAAAIFRPTTTTEGWRRPYVVDNDATGSGPSPAGGAPRSSADGVVLEVSASVPVSDGVCLTPGLVAVRTRGGWKSLSLALQSSWAF